jgi:UDP-3-O-[3-hydroxymyristoyl] N-acetylglucosamine deacetylase
MRLFVSQTTLAKRISLDGVGLHTGKPIHIDLLPADAGTGIVFKRTDVAASSPIEAHVLNIHSTDLNTTIGTNDLRVATIEHLMAAFAGLGVDNVIVKVNGPEVPVMDGSAQPFVDRILEAGICKQDSHRRVFVVKNACELRQGDKWIRIEPADSTIFSMEIDFRSRAIGRQTFEIDLGQKGFEEVVDSRTFCHVNDVNAMKKAGLALGGSLENAVVVSDDEVLNPEGLRCADEFVRHKLLDCIGDMALLGGPFLGKITAYKSGHGLHASFLKLLWQKRTEVFSIVEDSYSARVQDIAAAAHSLKP